MPCTALVKLEYQEKYYQFVEMLAAGAYHMGDMAQTLGVDRKTLYNWAKRDCFGADLDKAKRQILRLNLQQVLNVQKGKAILTGDTQAAKFYVETETASEKVINAKKSEEEAVNADAETFGDFYLGRGING